MSSPDPVPAEIRERIERAREARAEAIRKDASGDYVAYLRAVTAAKRELAAAYKAAYKAVPFPPQTLHYALLDAHIALEIVIAAEEREANEREREREERKAAREHAEARQRERTAFLEQQ